VALGSEKLDIGPSDDAFSEALGAIAAGLAERSFGTP